MKYILQQKYLKQNDYSLHTSDRKLTSSLFSCLNVMKMEISTTYRGHLYINFIFLTIYTIKPASQLNKICNSGSERIISHWQFGELECSLRWPPLRVWLEFIHLPELGGRAILNQVWLEDKRNFINFDPPSFFLYMNPHWGISSLLQTLEPKALFHGKLLYCHLCSWLVNSMSLWPFKSCISHVG